MCSEIKKQKISRYTISCGNCIPATDCTRTHSHTYVYRTCSHHVVVTCPRSEWHDRVSARANKIELVPPHTRWLENNAVVFLSLAFFFSAERLVKETTAFDSFSRRFAFALRANYANLERNVGEGVVIAGLGLSLIDKIMWQKEPRKDWFKNRIIRKRAVANFFRAVSIGVMTFFEKGGFLFLLTPSLLKYPLRYVILVTACFSLSFDSLSSYSKKIIVLRFAQTPELYRLLYNPNRIIQSVMTRSIFNRLLLCHEKGNDRKTCRDNTCVSQVVLVSRVDFARF